MQVLLKPESEKARLSRPRRHAATRPRPCPRIAGGRYSSFPRYAPEKASWQRFGCGLEFLRHASCTNGRTSCRLLSTSASQVAIARTSSLASLLSAPTAAGLKSAAKNARKVAPSSKSVCSLAYIVYFLFFCLMACAKRETPFAGKLCIEVSSADKVAKLSEELCIGCGICVKARGIVLWPLAACVVRSSTTDELICARRSAPLRRFLSSTCRRTWRRTLRTDTGPTRSSYTGAGASREADGGRFCALADAERAARAQASDATSRAGSGAGGNKRHREVDRAQDSCWQT